MGKTCIKEFWFNRKQHEAFQYFTEGIIRNKQDDLVEKIEFLCFSPNKPSKHCSEPNQTQQNSASDHCLQERLIGVSSTYYNEIRNRIIIQNDNKPMQYTSIYGCYVVNVSSENCDGVCFLLKT